MMLPRLLDKMQIHPLRLPSYTAPPPTRDVGEDFTPVDRHVSAVLGTECSVRDVHALYNLAPSGTKSYLDYAGSWPSGELCLSVSYRDQDGREVGDIDRLLKRHEDGSLEIHLMNQELDSSIRSQGVVPEMLRREADLAAQSPDGKLTLNAVGASGGKIGTTSGPGTDLNSPAPTSARKCATAFRAGRKSMICRA